MKAKAAVADGRGGFAIDEVEVGDAGAGEVQVELRASGVCHTDLKVLGRWPAMIMGHEGAGVGGGGGEGGGWGDASRGGGSGGAELGDAVRAVLCVPGGVAERL